MSKESLISKVGRVAATAGVVVGLSEVGFDVGQAIAEEELAARGLLTEESAPRRPIDYSDGLLATAVSAALRKYLAREEE